MRFSPAIPKIRINGHHTHRPPEPPEAGLCCGTGCHHCVWLAYADAVFDYYLSRATKATDQGQISRLFLQIRKELAKTEDPAIRSYLLTELASRFQKAQDEINRT
ncbi:hypothetical protein FGIG_09977 [Fasciola gigantica]|uniref:Oxidoreductase-like domain-containing protein n=1 Tax=Fasciola gigantica TaxID=46835 RepID=A0A504YBU2_FASGI|nr:hypothetical protein FGIG_09977 [Fasciola gigantica]